MPDCLLSTSLTQWQTTVNTQERVLLYFYYFIIIINYYNSLEKELITNFARGFLTTNNILINKSI